MACVALSAGPGHRGARDEAGAGCAGDGLPDDPAACGGAGLIKLKTRGVPEEAFFSASLSTGANTASLLPATLADDDPMRQDYAVDDDPRLGPLGYDGGRFDYLGYDDGGRALPAEVPAANEEVGALRELPSEARDGLAGLWSIKYPANLPQPPADRNAAPARPRSSSLRPVRAPRRSSKTTVILHSARPGHLGLGAAPAAVTRARGLLRASAGPCGRARR